MQKINVFINGFGRIGRALTRRLLDDGRFEIVGVNDIYPRDQFVYLLQYDSVYGPLPYRVVLGKGTMTVAGRTIRLFREEQAAAVELQGLDIDIVFQCSGVHLTGGANLPYLDKGVKKVIVSAPPQDDTPMYVAGVNDEAYAGEPVVSAASCSVNAIAPVLQLLQEHAGIESAGVSMIHSYTAEQHLLDAPSANGERLRSRSATANILPLSSSAAHAVGKVLPQIAQRIEADSIRVPVAAGTLYDFNVQLQKPLSAATINRLLTEASRERFRHLVAVTERTMASSDIIGDPHGITIETARTKIIGEKFVRLLGWQDNEAGYVSQMIRLALRLHNSDG